MNRCGSDMIRCGSDQTHIIIGHIPPSFPYMCLIRTTSNHCSHSSLLSLHVFDQNHIYSLVTFLPPFFTYV
jgi:hypothetical protein